MISTIRKMGVAGPRLTTSMWHPDAFHGQDDRQAMVIKRVKTGKWMHHKKMRDKEDDGHHSLEEFDADAVEYLHLLGVDLVLVVQVMRDKQLNVPVRMGVSYATMSHFDGDHAHSNCRCGAEAAQS